MAITYKESGVDKEEGYRLVDQAKSLAKATHNSNVLGEIGSFAALYELKNYQSPVLVSGTDGVGTKLEVAFKQGRYDTVGIDCVAMCVNDILCHGAKPLFFLDYLGCGKLDANHAAALVSGIAEGCKQADCALVGGETAEMPGFYRDGDYDIAGFSVGVVEKENIIDGRDVQIGDVIIGLRSSGVHSNGFSLIRKLFPDLNEMIENDTGKQVPVGEVLLTPTQIYVKPILELLKEIPVKAMAHITGGGLIENIPRVLKQGLSAEIKTDSIQIPAIFKAIEDKGVCRDEMWQTFNMGVGFTLIVDPINQKKVIELLQSLGQNPSIIGTIKKQNQSEKICLI